MVPTGHRQINVGGSKLLSHITYVFFSTHTHKKKYDIYIFIEMNYY